MSASSAGRRALCALALAATVLLGCPSPGPTPTLSAVTPDRGPNDRAVSIVISGQHLGPRLFTDFSQTRGSALDVTYTARLGREHLTDVTLADDGLHATVPAGLTPGSYELTVVDPAGRTLTLPDAYLVLSLDAVASLVVAYRVEPVGPQRVGVPFAVAITAVDASGGLVEGFSGTTRLADRTGAAVPKDLAWFAGGRWVGPVEVRATSAADALTVTDADGHTGTSNDFAVTVGPGAALRFSTPPRSAAAGACSAAVTVEQVDGIGSPSPAAADLPLALSPVPATGFALFGDAACSSPLVGPALAAGNSSLTVYFRSTRAGAVEFAAAAPQRAGAVQLEVVTPGPPSKLAFTTPAPTVTAGACSPTVTLGVRDAFDNPSPVPAALTVGLSAAPAAGFTFSPAPGCGTTASQVTVPAAQATVDLSFTATASGVVTMTASAAPLADATQAVRVNPMGFAAKLAIVSPPQTLMVSSCSGPLAVQTQDSLGNAVSNPGALTVALSAVPGGGMAFFSDAACTAAITGFPLGAGVSTAAVYFRGLQAGAVTVQVSSGGLQGDQQTQTLLPGPPAQLAIVTAPQTVTVGACSAEVVVQVQDSLGFATAVAADTAVAVAALPGTGFTLYADAACATPATSLTVPAGQGTARAWFKGTLAGTQTVGAQSAGLSPAQQVETLQAAALAQLAFVTAPQTVSAGACSGVATVEGRDAFGNPATSAAPRTLSLAAAPAGGFTFFADPGCVSPITTQSLPAGAARGSFFFKGTSMGQVLVTVSSAGLASAQQTQTIVPGAPAALAFASAPQTRAAGACSGAATVEVRDSLGNASPVAAATAVALSAAPSGGFTFYADAACATAVGSVQVSAGAATATLYFTGTVAQGVDVTAAAAGLSPAAQRETITAGADAALAFTTPPRTVTAGACSGNLDVTVQDAFGNAAAQAAARAVTLAAAPAAGFAFYADAACATPAAGVTVAPGAATASLYVKGTAAGGVTVTASSAGVTSASQAVTVTAAASPTRLAFTTPPRTVLSAQCSAVLTVQAQDSFGNPRTVAAATTVTLSAAPASGVTFFTDATCGTPAPGNALTIGAGADSASFYVRGGTAGGVTVTASAAALNPATQPVTVNPGPPDHLVFTTAPQTLAAGACSALAQVQSQDSQNNVSAPAAGTPVALASGSGITFYSDASCTTAITGVTLGPGASTAGFYFRGTAAGPRTLSATAAGLTPATQGETITPGAPSKLVITSAPQTTQAGACSGQAVVEVRDAFDNPVTLGSALPVDLAQAGVAVALYSGTCAGATTQVTVAAGASSTTFTLRGTAAGAVTVTASAPGLTPASQVETVTAAAPSVLVITSGPQTLGAGACSALATVEVRDAYGNPSPVGAATAVSLSAAPPTGFTFFTAAGCATATAGVVVGAGSSQATFAFRGTTSGSITLTAAAAGLTSGTQVETINPGPATSFAWDPVGSPQTLSTPFGVTVRALDQYGNPATGFTGTAALSVSGGTTVSCTASCTNAGTTDVFVAGVWTGTLTLGGAVGTGRVLTATQATVTGNSNPFTVQSLNRSPPTARFTATPRVVLVGQTVTFDASASSDQQTPTASLQVSWDFTGAAPGGPPWSAWTTTKTATNSYGTAGTYAVRLAVLDTDGDVGSTVGWVQVLPSGTNRCVVDTTSLTDDGATSCTNKGPDGRLSIVEAVRLSNSMSGTQTIAFSGPMTISGSAALNFTNSVDVVAPTGVILIGLQPSVSNGATVRLFGLELSGQPNDLSISSGSTLRIYDSYIHDADSINNSGTLLLDGVTLANCRNRCVVTNGNTTVRYSLFRSTNDQGLDTDATCASTPAIDVFATVFTGMAVGISVDCPNAVLVRSNTFHANGTAIEWTAGGSNETLVDNVFTSNTVTAASCGTATFAQRHHHLLLGNASDGCLAGDPNGLTSDPVYVLPASWDFRLTFGSPAIDTAQDLSLPLNRTAPPNFLGAGPDRGGRESY